MKSPIAIFCYNRVKTLSYLIRSLSACTDVQEYIAYFFCDAPSYKKKDDERKVNEVKDYLVTIDNMHIFKKVMIIYADHHLGLRNSVINGLSMVLQECGRVIHLEDDLVVARDFLSYMDDALDYFEKDTRIWSISAFTYMLNTLDNYPNDTFLIKRGCSLGMGTWKDRWETVDWEDNDYEHFRNDKKKWDEFADIGYDLPYNLYLQHEHQLDSWAIDWCYSQSKQKKVTVMNRKSRVYHHGTEGTHITQDEIRQQKEILNPLPYSFDNARSDADIDKELRSYVISEYQYADHKKNGFPKLDKAIRYYRFLDKWMKIRDNDINLKAFFKNIGVHSIAVYGAGDFAVHLASELDDSEICIEYYIDQVKEGDFLGKPIYSLQDNLRKVEAIVITPFCSFYEIKQEILKVIKTKVYSITELV